jgi:metal-sulfur cluster biosynthetic enzyme
MSEAESTPTTPPAPAAATPTVTVPPATGPHAEAEANMMKELKKIYDPEIPMNIVDLGIIYGFEWGAADDVTLHMTLTAPGCPVAGVLADEIKATIEKVPNVAKATVDFVWEPPWTPEKMTDFAKRQFGYL